MESSRPVISQVKIEETNESRFYNRKMANILLFRNRSVSEIGQSKEAVGSLNFKHNKEGDNSFISSGAVTINSRSGEVQKSRKLLSPSHFVKVIIPSTKQKSNTKKYQEKIM